MGHHFEIFEYLAYASPQIQCVYRNWYHAINPVDGPKQWLIFNSFNFFFFCRTFTLISKNNFILFEFQVLPIISRALIIVSLIHWFHKTWFFSPVHFLRLINLDAFEITYRFQINLFAFQAICDSGPFFSNNGIVSD